MSEEGETDRLLDSFQQWQLGIVVLVVVTVAGSLSAIALQSLGVPYGDGIGFVAGAVVAFLALSYRYYGR